MRATRSAARQPRRRALHEQLLLTFAPLGAIVLVGLGAVQFALAVRREVGNSQTRLQAAAQSIALACENYLSRHTAAVALLAANLSQEPRPFEPTTLDRHLARCREANPGFVTMIVANRDGHIVAASPSTDAAGGKVAAQGHAVADRPYFTAALAGRTPFVSEAFRGRGFGGDSIIAISIAPRAASGEPLGVIEGSLDLLRLHDLIGAAQAILDRSVLIIDHGGRVVLSTDPQFPVLSSVSGWRWQPDESGASHGTLTSTGAEPGSYVAGTSRTEVGDWTVVVRRPLASLRREVLRGETFGWLALLGALATFAALVFRASHQLAQPVRDLRKRLGTLSLEERPEPLPTPPNASSETASLIDAFNGMERRLAAAHRELAATLAGLESRVRERTAALATSERRYREMVEQTLGFVCEHDLDGKLLLVNPAAADALGYQPMDLIGRRLSELMTPFAQERLGTYLETIARDGRADGLLEVTTRAGEVRTWHYHNILVREPAQPPHVIGHAIDVTERRRAEQEAQRRALHDPLTGAGNRDLFESHLRVALARAARTHERVAVLYLDLDSFKEINDRFGHAAGDRLLRTVVEKLRAALREADTIARLGGDEFGLILADVGDANDVARLAEKLTGVVADAAALAQVPQATASIGIALYPDDGGSGAGLLAAADAAMYRAKAARHR